MTEQTTISILGEEIPCDFQMLSVDKLKYLKENPRVYTSIHGEEWPEQSEELQVLIQKKMLNEPSVKNLMPRIKRDGGLTDPILVRFDTMEVVEGNSRLTVYKHLSKSDKTNKGKWELINCLVVSSLTKKQQYAYLNQTHVEGKTPWVTYEKANLAYTMLNIDKYSKEEVKETLRISSSELFKRIRVIELMGKIGDKDRSHFSHYNVLVRTKKIAEELENNTHLEEFLLSKIKKQGNDGSSENDFTAQELRDKLPRIIAKKKVLKKYVDDKSNLNDAYQNARLSGPHQNIKLALEKIDDIETNEISALDDAQLNSALIDIKKLCKESERIKLKLQKAKSS